MLSTFFFSSLYSTNKINISKVFYILLLCTMERNHGILRAIFVGIEPIIIWLVLGLQRLILVGLCNIFIVFLWHTTQSKHNTHSTGSKVFSYNANIQNLKTNNSYFWALSFVAFIGWIITYGIVQKDIFTNLARWLLVMWLLYWLFAIIVHGFTITRKSRLSKLFWGIIIVWLGRFLLLSPQWKDTLTWLWASLKNVFTVPKVAAPSADNEWTILPGETISWAEYTTGDETEEGVTNNNDTTTADSTTITPDTRNNTTPLTFAQVVPVIVAKYNLTKNGPDITFTNISKSHELYQDFKAWYTARFYGTNIHPSSIVSCNVYFVMLGIAQNWSVQYNSSTIFSAYAAEATKRWQTFGCTAGASVTEANLPL